MTWTAFAILAMFTLQKWQTFHIFLKGEHHDEKRGGCCIGRSFLLGDWLRAQLWIWYSECLWSVNNWTFRENLFNHVLIFVVGKMLILLLMEDLFLGDKYVLWLGILVCGWFWGDDWPHIHYVLLSGPLLTSISFYGSGIYYLRSIYSWVVKTSL